MSDVLVLYKSKYGSTKQYAEWIAGDLNADLYERSEFITKDWEKYSTVIYCGGLYANRVNGIGIIAGNQAKLRGKKIILVACGLSYPHVAESVTRVRNTLAKKLPQTLHENARLFLVRGGIRYSALNFIENFVLKMLEGTLRKRDPGTLGPEEQEMQNALGKDFSFVDRSFIQPIIDYYKTL